MVLILSIESAPLVRDFIIFEKFREWEEHVGVFTLGDVLGGESIGEDTFTLGSAVGTGEVEVGFEVMDGTE